MKFSKKQCDDRRNILHSLEALNERDLKKIIGGPEESDTTKPPPMPPPK
jgi:hypothetical protein